MYLLFLMQICYSILISRLDGYVILAANLDDFRSIAKKFVPEKLADKLVEMASESNAFKKYNEDPGSGQLDYDETDDSETDEASPEHMKPARSYDYSKKSNTHGENREPINIEDIVEKVKERLEKDYKIKQMVDKEKKVHDLDKSSDYDNRRPLISNVKYTKREMVTERYDMQKERYKQEPAFDTVQKEYPDKESRHELVSQRETLTAPGVEINKEKQYDIMEKDANYDEAIDNKATVPNLFEEIDMLKVNDSYEDYVTPKRVDIFDSKEFTKLPKRFNVKFVNVQTNTGKFIEHSTSTANTAKTSDIDYEVTEGEIKARTENMNFEEKETPRGYNWSAVVKVEAKGVKKPKMATMIPTREHFKMSSPNYYAKLPVIAEKYDFNEPLPEKDREPEDLRPFVNPPARINHKVKI